MEPVFFASPAAFRKWLAANHAKATEVLVGFHKVATGKPSMTWAQSVEEALCFGWIDGVRRSLGEGAYTIRFTPRKPGSTWSATNVRIAQRLIEEKRMRPAGLRAFEARTAAKTGTYSYENRAKAKLAPAEEARFRKDRKAWEAFQAMPPSYRTPALWWVASAKKPETRERRLAQLIADSAEGLRVKHLRRP